MKGVLAATVLVLGVALFGCGGLPALEEDTTETLQIESVDLPGRLWDPFMPPISDGSPVTIEGRLTIPATEEPVPAVIVTHGCGGMGGAERGWVDDLVDEGMAVLLLDSFGAREISTVCFGLETLNVGSVLVDVFRAADVLDDHPYVDGSRIAIMGLSFGGRSALWSALTRFQDAYDGIAFQAHVAFYPSTCYIRLVDDTEVSGGPIRIFHGTEDDWVPIEPCEDYVNRLTARGVDAEVYRFPGALHSFDNETLAISGFNQVDAPSPRNCEFVEIEGEIIDPDTGQVAGVGSPCVELGVTYGYDAKAHARAKTLLMDFLAEVFGMD